MDPARFGRHAGEAWLGPGGTLPQFWWAPRWAGILSGAIILVFFALDVILPRGATVAIGYCIVPAIAVGTRRQSFLLGTTVLCTLLTWVALFLEPVGYALWKSAFDRAMVTVVIWFALALVLRRAAVIRELVRQKHALGDARRELERSNADLSAFASVVAHDLRGPLNTIGLFAKLLSTSSTVRNDPQCIESLGSIVAMLTRMSEFIQSLLVYGRVGEGRVQLQLCDCAAVLNQVRRSLAADLERSGANVSNDPLPVIQADPALMAELLQNLVENGVKYHGPALPRIHVSAAQGPEGWLFRVQDNGIGVRPDELEQIFEPFCQTDAGKSVGKGVGLGLATCKRIVERHGGSIHAQSDPGQGTTFQFTLGPRSLAPSPSPRLAATKLPGDETSADAEPGTEIGHPAL
jgi:signal transduction histidine kinase